MKPEFTETNHDTNINAPNMFSKLHHQNNNPFTHNFQENDSNTSGSAATTKPNEGDEATIEVVKRPRGRPPGSKNKPKPPVFVTREPEQSSMSPYILEVPTGEDIIEAISRYCRNKNTGLCILSGSGTVANVTLRQPSSTPGATVTFHGRFDILTISATFHASGISSCAAVHDSFSISLAGPQGQIVGGLVAGALIAAGPVYVFAASFNNPAFHRLPLEDEMHSVSAGDEHSPVSVGGGHIPAAESGGMAMYSCHLPSDVVWAPARQQQPPPY